MCWPCCPFLSPSTVSYHHHHHHHHAMSFSSAEGAGSGTAPQNGFGRPSLSITMAYPPSLTKYPWPPSRIWKGGTIKGAALFAKEEITVTSLRRMTIRGWHRWLIFLHRYISDSIVVVVVDGFQRWVGMGWDEGHLAGEGNTALILSPPDGPRNTAETT